MPLDRDSVLDALLFQWRKYSYSLSIEATLYLSLQKPQDRLILASFIIHILSIKGRFGANLKGYEFLLFLFFILFFN